MSEKKIELIAQLLAKAESTTPEEAEALTEHAERLMVKYAIDQAVIDERRSQQGKASEKIITLRVTFTGAYRLELFNLGASVCSGLGAIKVLFSSYLNKEATLHMVGFESDVRQAKVLIDSLQIQAAVAVRAWWKINKPIYVHLSNYDQEAARRSFVNGFGKGAGKRIGENRQQQVHEAGTGTELVLVSREAKVQAVFEDMKKGKRSVRGGKGSLEAQISGYAKGQQANTGEKSMTQGRGISA